MTNILDSLLGRVDDDGLRTALAAEIASLRQTKDFGLVFERHVPENVRLYNHPIRRGVKVQDRAGDGPTWMVRRVRDGVAQLVGPRGEATARPVDELVSVREFGEPVYPGIVPLGAVQRGGDKPDHVVIKGENHHVLETLLYTHEGRIDCIYIDPPYNTGARDWKYNNNYVDARDAYRHSKWLAFMERRLLLAKRLLNPERSVLIVTIDEKEYLRLGLLLDQIFPHAVIQMITSCIKPSGSTRSAEFSRVEEYLFFVMFGCGPADHTTDMLRDDGAEPVEPITWQGLRRRGSTDWRRSHRPNGFYPIFIKDGAIHSVGEPIPLGANRLDVEPPEGCWAAWPLDPSGAEGRWQVSPDRLRQQLANGTAGLSSADPDTGTCSIHYLKSGDLKRIASGEVRVTGKSQDGRIAVEGGRTKRPKTMWVMESHDASAHGTALLSKFVPGRTFPFPKSLYAVEDTLRFFVADNPDAIVLDFFAGSGTTAHAVMRLNRQDGGRRRSIIVTNNEVSEEEAASLREAGHLPGDPEWEALGIFDHITRPRIIAAMTGQTPEGTPVKGEYRYTDEFPMAEGFEENVQFLELSYLDPNDVSRGKAFEAIAPLLWLKAGGRGTMISKPAKKYAAPQDAQYAILFDVAHWREFADEVRERDNLTHIFVVTDSVAEYQQVAAELPQTVELTMLYEDYLRNFEINGGAPS